MSRPGDPYGCSTIMSGTEGQTTLIFSNREDPLELDLPGNIVPLTIRKLQPCLGIDFIDPPV